MATLQDVATVVVDGTVVTTPTFQTVEITQNVATVIVNGNPTVVPTFDTVDITVPGTPDVVEITVAGPQGAPGVQNVYVSTTPPANPQVNWIWFDIS